MKPLMLSVPGAQKLTSDLREYLGHHVINTPDADPFEPVDLPSVDIVSGTQAFRLSAREALDLFYALEDCTSEQLFGTENHNHIYDDDYNEVVTVWIDPEKGGEARLEIAPEK